MAEKKSSTLDNFGRFFDRMNHETLTKQEFTQAVRAIVDILKKREENQMRILQDAIASMKTALSNATANAEDKMSATITDALNQIEQAKQKAIREQENSLNFIKDKMKRFEDSKLDDEMRLMSEMVAMIPEIPTFEIPVEITDGIKGLEKKITDLEAELREVRRMKARAGGGGGMTDIGVQAAAGRSVITETPSGAINGANTDYTLTRTPNAVLSFHINGQAIPSADYSISGVTLTFSTALPAALSGKEFEIVYI